MNGISSMGGLFSLPVLYALLCGLGVGGGLALLTVAIRGLPAKPDHEKANSRERLAELARFAGQRGSLAIGSIVATVLGAASASSSVIRSSRDTASAQASSTSSSVAS